MQRKLFLTVVVCGISATGLVAKDTNKAASLEIAFVDSFEAMRNCKAGIEVGKEIDDLRNKASQEIKNDADKLAKTETDLKNKASMLKPQELAKQERDFNKEKRNLEEKLREKEEEIKVTMQQKTEELAVKIEAGIVEVAKEKGVDAVIDKMTGRVMYTKEDNKGDITQEAIARVDKQSDMVAQTKKQEHEKTVLASAKEGQTPGSKA